MEETGEIRALPERYRKKGPFERPEPRPHMNRPRVKKVVTLTERIVSDPVHGEIRLRRGDNIVFTRAQGTHTISEREQIIARGRRVREQQGGLADYVFDLGNGNFATTSVNTALPVVAQAFSPWPLGTLSPGNMSSFNPLLLQAAPIGLMECPHPHHPELNQQPPRRLSKPQLRKGNCIRNPNPKYRRC